MLNRLRIRDRQRETDQGLEQEKISAELLDRVQVNAPYRLLVDRYLDLFLHYGIHPEIGFDAAVLEEWDMEAMTRVAHLLSEKGRRVTFHGPFMDLAPGGVDDRIREVSSLRLQRTMELVPLFHPGSVVFHAGYDDRRYHAHRQEWLASSVATWGPIAEQAEEKGVEIHLENVYERTPKMILSLIEKISSDRIGFCLDVGHMQAFADAPLLEWLDTLGPYLKEVHLHDNHGQGDTHGPVGSGRVPFEELFQYLSDKGIRPVLTLEPHEEASLWSSLENLEKLWPWKD
ncbi:MAG: sugar phosphate isomerase/epimerase [Deltaproteobacteria bacterium]|nr:MAG: sugar phosphate isomerase/epimerase [Deltaproteobacteria bacterium]